MNFKKEVEFYYSNTCASVKCAEIINNLLSNNIGFMRSNYDFIGGIICSFRFICKIILLKIGIMPRNTTETVLNGFTFNEMIIYIFISFLTSIMISVDISNDISREVKDGSIAINLVRPINYEKRMLFQ